MITIESPASASRVAAIVVTRASRRKVASRCVRATAEARRRLAVVRHPRYRPKKVAPECRGKATTGGAWQEEGSGPRRVPTLRFTTSGREAVAAEPESWCSGLRGPGLNRRPLGYEPSALPLRYPAARNEKAGSRPASVILGH